MGKQDMPSSYAKEYAEAYEDATEDSAREKWDKEVFEILTDLRTKLTQSTSEIFPLICPKCNSFKITVVFGTSRSLECLSCGSQFHITDKRINLNKKTP